MKGLTNLKNKDHKCFMWYHVRVINPQNSESFKYFIAYQKGGIVNPLCIILPQMSVYINYFENGSKSIIFWLKTMKCVKNMIKFEMRLNIN